ncbi:hypothetical protein OQI_23785 [Streptomyces pharetrae CZA14]|uniref:Uncharacterized protein n=1 Tax=Streptomyces pharetrae CZA14 TaxID=1144883 RepID=A0ABX3YFQ7_9ACTN|nr:hypothetical protein OQI_23785 [Streptomyces pharetrae CZA14]
MSDHHVYGTNTHTADELARLVGDRLGLVFTERESDCRGIYHLADAPEVRIEVQPNPIPGDDCDDDLYAPDHPTAKVLLLTTTPVPDPTLQARLRALEGLHHLGTDSL